MARTDAGAELTRQHRRRQMALRAAVLRDLQDLWGLWQVNDRGSFEQFERATITLIRSRHRDSAGLAAQYYEAFRTAEDVGGEPTPRIAERPDPDRLRGSLRATALGGTYKAVAAGFSPQAAKQNGFVRVSGAVSRQVMDGSRRTLVESSKSDRQAGGRWQRIPSGDPCEFCAMTAARGAVYSEETVDFESHDHCACEVEPVYPGSEMPEASRRYQEQWEEAQRRAREDPEWASSGTKNDALNNFRKVLEGR